MAAPHVSGVAALLFDAFPKAGVKKIRADRAQYGWGIVQAQVAYDCLANNCV